MKSVRMLSASMLAAAALVLGANAAEPDQLAGLKEQPNDIALLEKLKQSLAGVADTGERCRLGAVYCAGAMTYGDTSAGLDMRAKMARAFPKSPYVQELADNNVFDACACAGGKTEAPCRKCAGNGTCALCRGTGKGKAKDFNGNDTACLACKGGGKCGDCAGTGKVEKPCPDCGGRGKALSKDKCRALYLRLLGAQAAAEPAPAAVAQTPKANPPAGKFKMPAVKPPVEGVADPEIKAAFDAKISKLFAEHAAVVEEKDRKGWNHIGKVDREELIEEEKRITLEIKDWEVKACWDEATRETERMRAEAKRTRERKAEEQDFLTRKLADERSVKDANDRLGRFVNAALARAKEQAARMPIFSQYGVAYDDVEKVGSEKNTSVQRTQAFRELWDRARTCSDPNVRGLFMPFPSGLRYKVEDVRKARSGRYVVSLIAVEEEKAQGSMPDGACGAIAKALAPRPIDAQLYALEVEVPEEDEGVAALHKGGAMTSGDWIILVSLAHDGRMKAERCVYRNESELNASLQAGEMVRLQKAAAKAAAAEDAVAAPDQPQSLKPAPAKCGQCNGNGRMKCDSCNGTGKQVSSLPCSTCSGTGLFNGHRCSSCNGERFRSSPCRMCGGKGMSFCPFCGGDGQR